MSLPPSLRILLVDDEPGVAIAMRAVLGRAGHQVHVENDGRKALALIRADPQAFDVALVDHHMPHLSGLDLIRELRSEGYEIPLILISGLLIPELKEAAAELGVSGSLEKPFAASALLELFARIRCTTATAAG